MGFGAVRSHAEAEVKRFIERFQIPLLTTLDGKGIVSEGHPLCVGVIAGIVESVEERLRSSLA